MPHNRQRHLSRIILKKLKFARVVALQGARQTGKSFLCRELLREELPNLIYRTFDQTAERNFANRNPDTYLAQYSDSSPLAIDEAQKAPAIFDAVKLAVDNDPSPGRYILLGSTEFSKLTAIRESLTGRMSRSRLFPLLLSETLNYQFTSATSEFFINSSPRYETEELLRYLERGGFPGIFSVHNKTEREALLKDWLALTTERDIHTFPKIKAISEVAEEIIRAVALLPHPDLANIARYCKRDARLVKRHLEILKTLFVIEPLSPHKESIGKTIYFILDPGLLTILGASFERKLESWFLTEMLATTNYSEAETRRFYYYKRSTLSSMAFIEEWGERTSAIKISSTEDLDSRFFYLLSSFRQRVPHAKLVALGPNRRKAGEFKIETHPWTAIG